MALLVLQFVKPLYQLPISFFSNFTQSPGYNATAFRRDNLDYETLLKLYDSIKLILDARSKKLVENSHSLSLGASYSQARNVAKELSKLSI